MTWSPQTIGEDQPRPGTSTFQATLIVVDHFVGSVAMAETARPDGPRNCGHVVSGDGAAVTRPVTNRISAARMVTPESYMTEGSVNADHEAAVVASRTRALDGFLQARGAVQPVGADGGFRGAGGAVAQGADHGLVLGERLVVRGTDLRRVDEFVAIDLR